MIFLPVLVAEFVDGAKEVPISAILQPDEAEAGVCPSKIPQSVIPAVFLSGNPAFEEKKPGFPTEAFGNDG
jgi:hypothetical protein